MFIKLYSKKKVVYAERVTDMIIKVRDNFFLFLIPIVFIFCKEQLHGLKQHDDKLFRIIIMSMKILVNF